jgi:hypothetical protein
METKHKSPSDPDLKLMDQARQVSCVPGRDKLNQKWSFKIEPPIWRENA